MVSLADLWLSRVRATPLCAVFEHLDEKSLLSLPVPTRVLCDAVSGYEGRSPSGLVHNLTVGL